MTEQEDRQRHQDIVDVTDEFVDNLDVTRIVDEAERLGLDADELLHRVMVEARARLGA